MDGDVEVGEVSVATLVEEDVVGLDVTDGRDGRERKAEKGRQTDA